MVTHILFRSFVNNVTLNFISTMNTVFDCLCGLEFLAANTEVPGSISGATRFYE
jgi:hypothetical protein